jgi:hypothetical protein
MMRFRFTGSINRRFIKFETLLLALILALNFATQRSQADTGVCSGQTITLPFTDVMGSAFFCSIAQIYFQGITLGVTPTTYDPTGNVRRDQMAAFLARTQNSALNRGSRRAAHNQFWTTRPKYTVPQGVGTFGTTAVGNAPSMVASDGADLWVANFTSNSVSRLRASDGRLLETWTGATEAQGVLVALGRVFVTGSFGNLYVIDPSQAPGTVATLLFNALPSVPGSIAFDGEYLWVAGSGTVAKIELSFLTVSYYGGFGTVTYVLYDGANIWVTHNGSSIGSPGSLKKLDGDGGVITTVTVGTDPAQAVYDGTNIWVPNRASNSLSVVRPSDGAVLATLTGNGLNQPQTAAFDGQRILVTNYEGHSVSLWRAADFTPLGSFSTGSFSRPFGACSDGLNFWITLSLQNKLARF